MNSNTPKSVGFNPNPLIFSCALAFIASNARVITTNNFKDRLASISFFSLSMHTTPLPRIRGNYTMIDNIVSTYTFFIFHIQFSSVIYIIVMIVVFIYNEFNINKGDDDMADWLTSLETATPQEGFELAITLARKGVAYTQPSAEVREQLRPEYATNADSLTFASHVIATHFQTIAVANNYWK